MSVRGGTSEECPKLLSLREDTPLLALPDSVELLPSRPDWGLVGEAGIGCRGDCKGKGGHVRIPLPRQAGGPHVMRRPSCLLMNSSNPQQEFCFFSSRPHSLWPQQAQGTPESPAFVGQNMALPWLLGLRPLKPGPRLLALGWGLTEGLGHQSSGKGRKNLGWPWTR